MAGRILRSSDYQRMPWKNGGGVTAEIWKATAPDGAMLWRLSIADVAGDGPFSAFPGIDRWIMVIEGKGMELRISDLGTRRVERPFEPLAFSGDAKTDCRLINGPIRDFNFMVARDHAQGDLRGRESVGDAWGLGLNSGSSEVSVASPWPWPNEQAQPPARGRRGARKYA